MQSEYFDGKVELLTEKVEEVKIPKIKRLSWFRKEITIETQQKITHYAICSLSGAKFLLKIPIDKEYGRLKIGDTVSVHLDFKFGYACFHYERPKEEPTVFEV